MGMTNVWWRSVWVVQSSSGCISTGREITQPTPSVSLPPAAAAPIKGDDFAIDIISSWW